MSITSDELTRTRKASFWGQEYAITPVLLDTVLGDGKQVVGFAPLNTRPNYYVVRVDSQWCLDNWRWDAKEPFVEHTDEVYAAIEDEFGSARWCPSECEQGEHDNTGEECPYGKSPWPALDDEIGASWWLIEPKASFLSQCACPECIEREGRR